MTSHLLPPPAALACTSLSQRRFTPSGATLATCTNSLAPCSGTRPSRGAGSTTRCEAGNGQHAAPPPSGEEGKWAHHVSRSRLNGHDTLPLSLYNPYDNLPCDGRTQSEAEEACDPYTQKCQTAMHVWETSCRKCGGSGAIASYSRGGRGRGGARRTVYTCPTCHGLGCVRHTSSRVMPDVNGGNGQYTAGRPPCKITWSGEQKQKSLLDRFKEKLGG